jgi:hypothetical protein
MSNLPEGFRPLTVIDERTWSIKLVDVLAGLADRLVLLIPGLQRTLKIFFVRFGGPASPR